MRKPVAEISRNNAGSVLVSAPTLIPFPIFLSGQLF